MNFLHSEKFLDLKAGDLMIPLERVAHVQSNNNLEHALLVLTKSGYTAVPVLDYHDRLHGLISTPLIMEAILGLERIEFEKLESIRVEEVMNKKIPRIRPDSSLQQYLHLLVDHPFICVENDSGFFEGIVTRRVVLNLFTKHSSFTAEL